MVRFKNRYVLVEMNFANEESITKEIDESKLSTAIRDSVQLNFGDLGSSKVQLSLQIKYFNFLSRLAIIRIARDYIDIVTNSLFFVTHIGGEKAKLRQLHVSGTPKKIEIKARYILSMWLNAMLKKDFVTTTIEAELNQLIQKEFEILQNLEQ